MGSEGWTWYPSSFLWNDRHGLKYPCGNHTGLHFRYPRGPELDGRFGPKPSVAYQARLQGDVSWKPCLPVCWLMEGGMDSRMSVLRLCLLSPPLCYEDRDSRIPSSVHGLFTSVLPMPLSFASVPRASAMLSPKPVAMWDRCLVTWSKHHAPARSLSLIPHRIHQFAKGKQLGLDLWKLHAHFLPVNTALDRVPIFCTSHSFYNTFSLQANTLSLPHSFS